ncbi:unnamed protein product [Pleuronectes platessa]|uniref:Uncharacterized protein n=1 Tax=Pleuronectes platessa TaxID=8262 RepID=A0A9N7ZED4_PLEPL|nr:unnamed protein product [Pleuronectes platessa]
MESGESAEEKTAPASAAQRRAEIRRRKLLMNSEDRMNRIVGFTKIEAETKAGASLRPTEPRFHLDLDRTEWSSSLPRPTPFPAGGLRAQQPLPQRHPREKGLAPARQQ